MTKFEIIALAALAKLGFFEKRVCPAPFKMCIRTKDAGQRKPPSSFWKTRPLATVFVGGS